MRIVRAEIEHRRLKLRAPLTTSRATIAERESFVLRLYDEQGVWGAGEAAPPYWLGGETLKQTYASLSAVAELVARRSHPGTHPALLLPERKGRLSGACAARRTRLREAPGGERLCGRRRLAELAVALSPAARCALEAAMLDLEARLKGASVASLLSRALPKTSPNQPLYVSALLKARTAPGVYAEARALADKGFCAFKLKVGAREIEDDLALLRALRRALASSGAKTASIRLDANRAFSFGTALEFLKAALAEGPLEFVEEPLKRPAPAALARLRHELAVAIALDESVTSESQLRTYLRAGALDVVVVKTARLGGLSSALELARTALGAGARVCVTDAIEGPLGMAAAVHLGAALSPFALALGLGGARYLAERVLGDFPARAPILFACAPGFSVQAA